MAWFQFAHNFLGTKNPTSKLPVKIAQCDMALSLPELNQFKITEAEFVCNTPLQRDTDSLEFEYRYKYLNTKTHI